MDGLDLAKNSASVFTISVLFIFVHPAVSYQVRTHTSDQVGAGSDSNMFVNIIGERGDTGKRQLVDRSSDEMHFQRGAVKRYFVFYWIVDWVN